VTAHRSDLIDIEVTLHRDNENDLAVLVETEVSSPRRVWVPRSICEVTDKADPPSKRATLTIREPHAQEKGLI
jgi:hypothetical protein